ncbi:MAG: M48 family metalloprotease [Acidimicrobiia bacterium]|nr:M48 family metalloprotease [Acidimicrobiia bacterium]MYC57304.1 M48 family metalloprotease [Acidimicrobiia bacterium]MYG94507.1 M48 family metalloprotease [Acidimicrobiia bacterium]MYI31005.1 M48 family metalloprotease [Acidimicrobiia bacterium]
MTVKQRISEHTSKNQSGMTQDLTSWLQTGQAQPSQLQIARFRSAVCLGLVGLLIGLAVLAVAVVLGLWWPAGLVLSLVVALGSAFAMRQVAWRLLLGLIGGQAPTGAAQVSLQALLDGLCMSHGLPIPNVRLIESVAPNALAVARSADEAVIVVTSGLLKQLERIELEGLLAHQLCRIRRGDAAFETLAGVLVAWPLSKVGLLRRRVMNRLIPSARSLQADFDAVALTRYPPGLLAALQTIAGENAVGVAKATTGDAVVTTAGRDAQVPSTTVAALHMWFDEPDWGRGDEIRHPSLVTRIAALNEL